MALILNKMHAIGSKVQLDNSSRYSREFVSYIEDLMELKAVERLDKFDQHFKTSRLQHCVNVAYYSYRIALVIGADPRSSARAGMLHDLYWYDWHYKKTPQLHAFLHPRLALKNADRVTKLNDRERDAILKHMWPLYMGMPRYRESYAVTMADKYAATLEVCYNWGRHFGNKLTSVVK